MIMFSTLTLIVKLTPKALLLLSLTLLCKIFLKTIDFFVVVFADFNITFHFLILLVFDNNSFESYTHSDHKTMGYPDFQN